MFTKEQAELKSKIDSVKGWSTEYTEFQFEKWRNGWQCFICKRCCCKGRKTRRDIKQLQIGVRKLHEEIDILEIVKQLRYLRVLTSIQMSPS
jgi:hypothetical protein